MHFEGTHSEVKDVDVLTAFVKLEQEGQVLQSQSDLIKEEISQKGSHCGHIWRKE